MQGKRNNIESFFQKVDKTDSCWIWKGYVDKWGYGRWMIEGKRMLVHRYSYQVHHNSIIPSDKCVCHTCDNSLCVNPEHLWLGTHQQNRIDCVKKERQAKGNEHGLVKLTELQVKEMRTLFNGGLSVSEISRQMNLNTTTVHNAVHGRTWRWILEPPPCPKKSL